MVSQSIIALDKSLLELFEPSTSPEKALQLLASSFFKLEDYSEGDKELPVIFRSPIFLAYIRFVMDRQPDGKVEGIWEDILKKALMYIRNDVCIYYLFEESRDIYPPNIFPWLVPALREKLDTWVVNVLRNHHSCPNPYVRLDIFRLHVKLDRYSIIEYDPDDRESLCNTFRHTMCEVNPHCFFPSRNEYDPIFDVHDLDIMLREVYNNISYENFNDLNFLSNVIQLTGVFATRVGNEPVCQVLMSCNILNSLWDMSDQVTCQAIRNYVVETVREMTATAIISKESEAYQDVISRINLLINDLNLDTKLCDLPRLLLLRQVQGPRQVRQHALLLGGM